MDRSYRTRAFISSRNRVEGTSTDFETILSVPITADGWRLRSATIPLQISPWTPLNSGFTVQYTSFVEQSVRISSPLVIRGTDVFGATPYTDITVNVPQGTYSVTGLAAAINGAMPSNLYRDLGVTRIAEGSDQRLVFSTKVRPDALPTPLDIGVRNMWGSPVELIFTRTGTFGPTKNYVSFSWGGDTRTATFAPDIFYDGPAIVALLNAQIGILTPGPSGFGLAFVFNAGTGKLSFTMTNPGAALVPVDVFFPSPVFGTGSDFAETVIVDINSSATRSLAVNDVAVEDPATEFRWAPDIAVLNAELVQLPSSDGLDYVVAAFNDPAAAPPLADRANSSPLPWWSKATPGPARLNFKLSNWNVRSSRPLTELGLSTTYISVATNGTAFGIAGATGIVSDFSKSAPILDPIANYQVDAGSYNSDVRILAIAIDNALTHQLLTVQFSLAPGDAQVRYAFRNVGSLGKLLSFQRVGAGSPITLLIEPEAIVEGFDIGVNVQRFKRYEVRPNLDYHVTTALDLETGQTPLDSAQSDRFVNEEYASTSLISIPNGTYTSAQLETAYNTAISATPIGVRMRFDTTYGAASLVFPPVDAPDNLNHVLVGTNEKLGFTRNIDLPAWAAPTAQIPEIAFAVSLGPSAIASYIATRPWSNLPTTSLFIASATLTHRSVCSMGDQYHSDIIAHVPVANSARQGDLVEFINPVSEFEMWTSTRTITDVQMRLLDDQMRELGDDGSGQDCMIFIEFITAIV